MHLLISGAPGAGKTTFIRTFLKTLPSADGFYTEEVRQHGQRQGFRVRTLDGREKVFARKNFKFPQKVSGYSVDVEGFEDCAVSCLEQALQSQAQYLVIDEIGAMELFSRKFRAVVARALAEKQVIASVPARHRDPFLTGITGRKDVCVLELTRNNFSSLLETADLWTQALDSASIKALDEKARALGLSERILIENAASNLAAAAEKISLGKRVLIVSGRGNNGADTLSCGRKLLSRGYAVSAVIASEKEVNEEVRFQQQVLEQLLPCIRIKKHDDTAQLKELCGRTDFIIEGLVGTGLRGPVDIFLAEVIAAINGSGKPVVSCDIPSGLSPDHGYCQGETIRAALTVSFLAPKKGFFLNQGLRFCGKIIVTDIGISRSVLLAQAEKRGVNNCHGTHTI